MPQTCRQYWLNMRGRCTLNFNWDAINHDSVVLVSASEWQPNQPDPPHSPRFVGDANIRVDNISPHGPPFDRNHGVSFVVTVDWDQPLHLVTDITVLDAAPVFTGWQGDQLAFNMQHQQESNWCWAATATSVAHFYDAGSTWSQCTVANQQLSRTDCCGSGAGGACNVPQPGDGPLQVVGHFDHWLPGTSDYPTVRGQIDVARPLCVRIGWAGGGGHFVAITGYHATASGQWLHVDDPAYGPSDTLFVNFETNYQGSGSWTESHFTKP
jgi:hypothetical protein